MYRALLRLQAEAKLELNVAFTGERGISLDTSVFERAAKKMLKWIWLHIISTSVAVTLEKWK